MDNCNILYSRIYLFASAMYRSFISLFRTIESFLVVAIWMVLARSEEHTSELQSQSNLVCRLLLEKKKKRHNAYRTVGSQMGESYRVGYSYRSQDGSVSGLHYDLNHASQARRVNDSLRKTNNGIER